MVLFTFCLVDKQLNDIDVREKKYLLNAALISYLSGTCSVKVISLKMDES